MKSGKKATKEAAANLDLEALPAPVSEEGFSEEDTRPFKFIHDILVENAGRNLLVFGLLYDEPDESAREDLDAELIRSKGFKLTHLLRFLRGVRRGIEQAREACFDKGNRISWTHLDVEEGKEAPMLAKVPISTALRITRLGIQSAIALAEKGSPELYEEVLHRLVFCSSFLISRNYDNDKALSVLSRWGSEWLSELRKKGWVPGKPRR